MFRSGRHLCAIVVCLVSSQAAYAHLCALAVCLVSSQAACQPPRAADQPRQATRVDRHVIVVSVDGLMPEAYTAPDAHGLKVPTLRMLRDAGAYSDGALSVFPTLTYPAHTSIATGATPARHGIASNRAWDPLRRNHNGWSWYAEDIRVPALWQVAEQAGLPTAILGWPVTVGAQVTYRLPEFWRAGTADDVKLLKAVSTRGLFERVNRRFPTFIDDLTPPDIPDDVMIDAAVYLIETAPPALMWIHTWKTDSAQHSHGPWADEAKASIEHADSQLARLIAAARRAGSWQRTLLVVVSDHGFRAIDRWIHPWVVIVELGLVTPGDDGSFASWKAQAVANGGSAYLYVKDDDQATRDVLRARFRALAADPQNGIAHVWEREQIAALGGDPRAFLALGAAPGFAFSTRRDGPLVTESKTRGHHGYSPDAPGMEASLLLVGPGIKPGPIAGARLIDVAPTIAQWLGLALPDAQGQALPVWSESGR